MRTARIISMTRARHERYATRLDLPVGNTWAELAACANTLEPDNWFPESSVHDTAETLRAKEICRNDCQVAQQCFDASLKRKEKEGIWGGVRFIPSKTRTDLFAERAEIVKGARDE